MKKMLMIASVPSMIGQFNMNNIQILINLGFEVEVACDWGDRSVWTDEKVNDLKEKLNALDVIYHQIDYSRSPFSIGCHIKSYKQTLKLLRENSYEFVHCHTPIASAVTRLACKKTNTKCIYTAHGFHFYKGAPIKNWIIFYPIEKWLSKYTDVLITINMEDYNRAKERFKMKKIYRVPGVGINYNKFYECVVNRDEYRKKLNIYPNDFVILSVGELCDRKNHITIMKSVKKLDDITVKYLVVGKGSEQEYLQNYINREELNSQIQLLGFRTDIPELCKASDIFAFPSKREGLGLAAIEAMASGIPIITSDINGINDYSKNYITGFKCNPNDISSFANYIKILKDDMSLRNKMIKNNLEIAKKYDLKEVDKIMMEIYNTILW